MPIRATVDGNVTLVNDAQLGSAIDTNVFSGEINIDPEDTAQNTSTTNFTKNTFKVDEETGKVTIEKTETQTFPFPFGN